MSYKNINTALRSVIVDFDFFGLRVENWQSSPNVDFSSQEPKARVSFVYDQPEAREIGANNSEEITGFMQIDLYYPSGQGDSAINEKADQIKTAFGPNRITANDDTVRIIKSGINTNPLTDNGWYNLFVQVDFSYYYCNSSTNPLIPDGAINWWFFT